MGRPLQYTGDMKLANDTLPNAVFWGEIAPTEHLVQLYGDDESFLDSLEGFVAGGLLKGEAVIVIATPAHRSALERRLSARDEIDLGAAVRADQFIAADAEETLAKFMVERQGQKWPDDQRFEQVVSGLLMRARWGGERPAADAVPHATGERTVRTFGEMVALLWASGDTGATVRLEHLWNRLRDIGTGANGGGGFPLFCAYPRTGFTQNTDASLRDICACHTQVIGANLAN